MQLVNAVKLHLHLRVTRISVLVYVYDFYLHYIIESYAIQRVETVSIIATSKRKRTAVLRTLIPIAAKLKHEDVINRQRRFWVKQSLQSGAVELKRNH